MKKGWIVAIVVLVALAIASYTYFGRANRAEVELDFGSTEESEAQVQQMLEKMTPEQRQAYEAMREAFGKQREDQLKWEKEHGRN